MFNLKKFFSKVFKSKIENPSEIIENPEDNIKEECERILKIKRMHNESYTLDDESLKQAEKEFKEKLEYKVIHCEFFPNEDSYKIRFKGDIIRFLTINLPNSCGKIVDIDDEHVSIIINHGFKNGRLLLDLLDKVSDNLYAYGRCISDMSSPNSSKAINRIITFDIVYKEGE